MDGPHRILLVEDDALVRGYFGTVLREAGYSVDEAVDGIDAVERFRANRPDCILLDICLPRMNGLDALIAIDPRRSGVPVVAMSGIPFTTESEPYLLAKALGAARFLPKPFPGSELLTVLREVSGAPA
jgi:DNA-binding response OmpR family regulator